MKQLRIGDNAVVPQASFCEISGITQKIANKTLKQLEREGVFVFPEQIAESDDLAAEQMILQHEQHQIGSGSRQIFGLLFDGAWLWEEYIHSLLGDRFYHPMNKRGIGAQWLFSQSNGLIYPDFISRGDVQCVIADEKYKPMNNIGNRDYLQMLAYMFRFDAKKGIFCYTETGQAGTVHLKLNKGSTYENNVAPREDICGVKHGLIIPQKASCYERIAAERIEGDAGSMIQCSDSGQRDCRAAGNGNGLGEKYDLHVDYTRGKQRFYPAHRSRFCLYATGIARRNSAP